MVYMICIAFLTRLVYSSKLTTYLLLIICYMVVQVAEKSLEEVKLTTAARVRSGNYSGGMKRRLSVAIALIGDPKMVFLDEPVCDES